MEKSVKQVKLGDSSYFAAANSFDGFKSYFDICFNPLEFDRLYILKGGPGTGKSTLMRKVLALKDELSLYGEAIYCSSDIKSLDGVILSNDVRRIAIVDGTAPHIVEPQLPGACEVIVNLGEYFDTDRLVAERKTIKALNEKKNNYYRLAYSEMALSSVFDRNIKAEFAKRFNYDKARNLANQLVQELNSDGMGTCTTRLISAFGRGGRVRATTLDDCCKNIYSLKGSGGCAEIFAQLLLAKIKKTKSDIYIFPQCLDTSSTEAIYLPDISRAAIVNSPVGTVIDCEQFMSCDDCIGEFEEFYRITDSLLARAQSYFKSAAENHFMLEDIYSSSVDFDMVEEKSSQLLCEIKNILS